jgi:hypothetical protein
MAQNVTLPGAGAAIAADLITGDASLGTADVQFVKIMDGTIGGTAKAAVGANGLKVDPSGVMDFTTGVVNGAAAGVIATLGPMSGQSFALLRINSLTGAATINVQGSLDGVTYSALAIANIGQAPGVAAITAAGTYGIPGASGFKYLQVVQNNTGTSAVILSSTSGSGGARFVFSVLANAFKTEANGAATTAAPSYTNGTDNPLSLNLAGGLRVDGSGVTQPVSLADSRPASTTISAVDAGTTTIAGMGGVTLVTGTPTANSFQVQAVTGMSSATVTVPTTPFVATLNIEGSADGGTTYTPLQGSVRGSDLLASKITQAAVVGLDVTGLTHVRVRASAYTSGTPVVQMTFSPAPGMTKLTSGVKLVDSGGTDATDTVNHAVRVSGTVQTGGSTDVLNITTATVIKASAGRLAMVSVLVAGSTDGTANDCTTTGAAAVANQFGIIPQFTGVSVFDWPCGAGIVVIPGTGQTLAVSYT